MPDRQLLHLVIGGVLQDVEHVTFKDLSKVQFIGAFPNYQAALSAWRAAAQATVDNAMMRYFIIHAHKLLDPASDEDHEH